MSGLEAISLLHFVNLILFTLSSWFTSYCPVHTMYHLITVTTFVLTLSVFHSRLKTHLFHKSFPS